MSERPTNVPRTSYEIARLRAAPRPPLAQAYRAGLMTVLAVGVAVSACSTGTSALEPSRVADMAGRVTSVTASGAYAGTIRVEENPASSTTGAKALVTVPASATIVLITRAEGDFRALTVGQWVRVWFTGAVATSYPVQGSAQAIAIDSASISVVK